MNSFKKLLLIFTLASIQACAHKRLPRPGENTAVLNLAKQAYIKGCVDAHHLHKKKKVFFECQELSKKYIQDIYEIIK
jgi:hypothetical protein